MYVTHDQEEALSMSTKIVLMNKGKIEQMSDPVELYNKPINLLQQNLWDFQHLLYWSNELKNHNDFLLNLSLRIITKTKYVLGL